MYIPSTQHVHIMPHPISVPDGPLVDLSIHFVHTYHKESQCDCPRDVDSSVP